MLFDGNGDGGDVAGGGQAEEIGGHAGERCRGKGDSAVDCRGGRGGLGGQQRSLGADAVRGAGRGPGVKGLVEGYRAAGHGVAVRVQQAEGDLAGSGLQGEALGGSRDRFKKRVLRPRSEGVEGDALAGAIETGGSGDLLAFNERAYGEDFGGDAARVGDGGGTAERGDAARRDRKSV